MIYHVGACVEGSAPLCGALGGETVLSIFEAETRAADTDGEVCESCQRHYSNADESASWAQPDVDDFDGGDSWQDEDE